MGAGAVAGQPGGAREPRRGAAQHRPARTRRRPRRGPCAPRCGQPDLHKPAPLCLLSHLGIMHTYIHTYISLRRGVVWQPRPRLRPSRRRLRESSPTPPLCNRPPHPPHPTLQPPPPLSYNLLPPQPSLLAPASTAFPCGHPRSTPQNSPDALASAPPAQRRRAFRQQVSEKRTLTVAALFAGKCRRPWLSFGTAPLSSNTSRPFAPVAPYSPLPPPSSPLSRLFTPLPPTAPAQPLCLGPGAAPRLSLSAVSLSLCRPSCVPGAAPRLPGGYRGAALSQCVPCPPAPPLSLAFLSM